MAVQSVVAMADSLAVRTVVQMAYNWDVWKVDMMALAKVEWRGKEMVAMKAGTMAVLTVVSKVDY